MLRVISKKNLCSLGLLALATFVSSTSYSRQVQRLDYVNFGSVEFTALEIRGTSSVAVKAVLTVDKDLNFTQLEVLGSNGFPVFVEFNSRLSTRCSDGSIITTAPRNVNLLDNPELAVIIHNCPDDTYPIRTEATLDPLGSLFPF